MIEVITFLIMMIALILLAYDYGFREGRFFEAREHNEFLRKLTSKGPVKP